jgi:hypothetical protein
MTTDAVPDSTTAGHRSYFCGVREGQTFLLHDKKTKGRDTNSSSVFTLNAVKVGI